jgi:transcriptional regulator with XRE-family HTH domain
MFDGRKLRKLREEKDWTLQELGIRMDPEHPVPLTTVYQWETRAPDKNKVQFETVLKARKALNCSLYDLVSNDILKADMDRLVEIVAKHRPNLIKKQ